jgi:hypothetical protein
VVDHHRDAAESPGLPLKVLGVTAHVVYNNPDALAALGLGCDILVVQRMRIAIL